MQLTCHLVLISVGVVEVEVRVDGDYLHRLAGVPRDDEHFAGP